MPSSEGYAGKAPGFFAHFRNHGFQKIAHVDTAGGAVHDGGRAFQFAGNGDGHGAAHQRRRLARTQPFQNLIAAHAEACQHKGPVPVFRPAHDGGEIAGFAHVIEAIREIGLPGTAPHVPGQNIKAQREERSRHAAHVMAAAVAFQTMRNDGDALGRRRMPVNIHIQKVAVPGCQALALRLRRYAGLREGHATKEGRPDGVDMRRTAPPRAGIAAGNYWHGWTSYATNPT